MRRTRQSIARCVIASLVLLAVTLRPAAAGDHVRQEPRAFRGKCASCPYYRETNHGHLHYGCTTYWASGDIVHTGDANGSRSTYTQGIAPSPWAYRSIAPYAFHYHSRDGHGGCDSYDCRN